MFFMFRMGTIGGNYLLAQNNKTQFVLVNETSGNIFIVFEIELGMSLVDASFFSRKRLYQRNSGRS